MAATILLAVAEGGSLLVATTNLSLIGVPLLTLVLSPFAWHRWTGAPAAAHYDAFEQAALSRATSTSNAIMFRGCAVLFAYMAIGSELGWPVPGTARAWAAMAIMWCNIGISLPVTIAEWTIPLPSHSDDE